MLTANSEAEVENASADAFLTAESARALSRAKRQAPFRDRLYFDGCPSMTMQASMEKVIAA